MNTTGNPSSHLVLRGGDTGPNYEAAEVAAALDTLRKANLPARLIVDCSHMNAAKDHAREGNVFRDVLAQRLAGNDGIVGVMLESHLFEGSQPLGDGKSLKYGVSITDACIGWDETESLLIDAQRQLSTPR